jgi:hypothetical protein
MIMGRHSVYQQSECDCRQQYGGPRRPKQEMCHIVERLLLDAPHGATVTRDMPNRISDGLGMSLC